MTPERLRAIEALFHDARERPPAEREPFLAHACAGDAALRREVESLLAQPAAAMIDAPLGEIVARLAGPPNPPITGMRLGAFEVLGRLGVGGMGEVYRARDTRLGREVAIKILPRAFKDDPDRLARFDREARVLASLNDPHIGALYGVEDADECSALVMELVEGEDLATRLTRGAMPLVETLPIARQIAEALEVAHDQGVIHRDLKPANIMVRGDGTVKVLDFGLAKALDPTAAPRSNPDYSPSISMFATRAGVLLGTAAYMPPEQAKGKAVDKRADLWSFGCVLFEMLTGRRPFAGETISDVLAKIIERDPDWQTLPATTPRSIRRLLRRCLEKDPKQRLDSAAVARLEIEEAATAGPNDGLPSESGNRTPRWTRTRLLAVAAVAVAAAAVTWSLTRPAQAPPSPVSRFAVTLPAAQPLAFSINDRDLAISADGTHLAYTAGGDAQLMMRALDRLEAAPLAGIANARAPFFSPDARWIGYFERLDEGFKIGPVGQRGTLKKVSTSGGPPITLGTLTGASRGAAWSRDDSIVFATSDPATGLLRLPAGGGEPEVLTKPDASEEDHYFPFVLPGGQSVLFTVAASGDKRRVAVLDLKTGRSKTVIRSGSQAEYVETGHLIYSDGGALWAVRFDLSALDVVGDPLPLGERVLTLGAADFTMSRSGTLVYVPASVNSARSLVWVTRQGDETPIAAPPQPYTSVRLSPDGTRAALTDQSSLWTWDFAREKLTRLTASLDSGNFLVWTPDGRHLITGRRGRAPEPTNLYRHTADESGNEERLTTSRRFHRPDAISADGSRLVFEEQIPSGGYALMMLSMRGTPRVEPLFQTPFDERNAALSPDGQWMAYESNESGQSRIYVRPFPQLAGARHEISTGSGRTPAWGPDGRELFFIDRTSLMAVTVQLTPTFSAGNPTKLFDAPSFLLDGRFVRTGTQRTYDISRDGQRFLMIRNDASSSDRNRSPTSMIVVQNWFKELTAKVVKDPP